jgi:protein-L-isoaspartate(D-aspartate) O-methyltransferase
MENVVENLVENAVENYKFEVRRRQMVRLLAKEGIKDPSVRHWMEEIPREKFIAPQLQTESYRDKALPIGEEQTISQPYIVALMTQELNITKDCDILEIGTGSGYQTAILAKLAHHVYTIERIRPLQIKAQDTLQKLNITNVDFYAGDGSCGWPEDMRFDRILISAAAANFPDPLAAQLKVGGIAVMGMDTDRSGKLVKIEKTADDFKLQFICNCRFVKLIGKHGFTKQ